jgi:glycosyltransferase involved in cell wall biosynthesis/ADP-heptose:LPS heptosyltransferase
MAPQVPHKLLMVRPDTYGDIVLFQPVLQVLRQTWSKTEIAVLIQERYADLTPLLTPGIRWLTTKCDPYHAGPDADLESLVVLRREITEFAPDCVVAACFDKTWLDAAIASFAPAARQISLGVYQLDAMSRILLSKTVSVDCTEIYRESVHVTTDSHEWDKNLRLARHLTGREVGRVCPQLTVPKAASQEAAEFLRVAALKSDGFGACCPAGIANVPIKTWPAEKYGEVVAWLSERHGLPTLLLGHEAEKDVLAAVRRTAKDRGADPAVWTGKNGQIATLAALLSQSRFCFGNDSGPLHLAGALNRPVAAVFGGGHWPRFRPVARRSICVVQPLPCFGCSWDCHFGDAPCVNTIPTDALKDAIGRLLSSAEDMDENVLVQAGMTSAELELIAKTATTMKHSRYIHMGGIGGPAELLPRSAVERLIGQFQLSEADRAARLRVIETQGAQMVSLEAAVRHSLEQNHALSQQVGNLETERKLVQTRLTELQQQLQVSEADRAARLRVIETQVAQMISLEAAVRHSLEQNHALSQQVGNLETERKLVQTRLTELQQQLQASEADRAAREREIGAQRQVISEADSERRRQRAEIGYLKASGEEMQAALHRLGKSQIYRVVRALGQWRSLDRYAGAVTKVDSATHHSSNNRSRRTLRRVVVDLTPVLPGADNGGAKLVAMELVRHLARLAPSCNWILLTSENGHADLAPLDSHNVRRVCARPDAVRGSAKPLGRARGLARLLQRSGGSSHRGLLRQLDADVVFCPFTTARFFDPRVPMVAILHDLQYLAYPEFFSREERAHRDRQFRDVCRFATRVVCISDYVRGTVLQHGMVDPSRVTTIHTSLFRRLADGPAVEDTDVRQRLGLQAGRYLLYPANFWPHKNHEMLLTAFGMYRARHPASDLKLVCTGGLGARREQLQEAVEQMGLAGQVAVIGFVPDKEFAALLRACRALVFPSLFEGFGMPPLEAMAFDKPVLCSNLTSLPEVVGDAALLFDPRKPMEMMNAIERVESDSELVAQLIRRGQNRLAAFDDAAGMARRYLQVIQDALTGDNHFAPAIHGVFSDGWTGERVTVLHGPSDAPRYLEMTLHVPPWLPAETISVHLASPGGDGSETHVIKRDQTVTLRHRLPAASCSVEVQIHPTFQPLAQRMGADTRVLGCLCRSCRILSPTETVDLFGGEVPA